MARVASGGVVCGLFGFALGAVLLMSGCRAQSVDTLAVVNRIDAPDPAIRAEAIGYWLNGTDSTPSRIAPQKELWRAVDASSDGFRPDTLRDLYRHLTDRRSSPAYEVSALMPLTYQRMLQTALKDRAFDEQERRRIMHMIVPSKDGGVNRNGRYGLLWDVAGDAERTAIWETHRAVFEALAKDREASNGDWYFYDAYVVMGADSAELLDMLLDAKSPAVRQRAWLLWGLMDMSSDRTPDWESQPQAVAMCMVAAETLRSGEPDTRVDRLLSGDTDRIEMGQIRLDDTLREELRVLVLQVDYAAGMAKHRREYLIQATQPWKVSNGYPSARKRDGD